jgi:hypothetical protein
LFSIIFPLKITPIKAEGSYFRVITEDTPFYLTQTDSTPLFFLPYTYYVKVIREEVNFYYVEYGEGNDMPCIDGYVPKDMLFDDGLSAESRYPFLTLITSNSSSLYEDVSKNKTLQYVFKDRELIFYGTNFSSNGETLYFVSYNNKLGYVSEENVIPFTIANHPNPLTFLPEEKPPKTEPIEPPKKENGTLTLRYLIIGILAFAGIFALIVVFKGKPNAKTNGYFDENEYE